MLGTHVKGCVAGAAYIVAILNVGVAFRATQDLDIVLRVEGAGRESRPESDGSRQPGTGNCDGRPAEDFGLGP